LGYQIDFAIFSRALSVFVEEALVDLVVLVVTADAVPTEVVLLLEDAQVLGSGAHDVEAEVAGCGLGFFS
jgi:hypothetical protein